ncbi:hypothetical protein PHISP_08365 [Aspergillus sp. HF37]|nr:hypothetical protein PHISP_08365 [Aspergillus sp. HF37]
MGVSVTYGRIGESGRAIWVDGEANEFLYGDEPNPFGREDGSFPEEVPYGMGVERDAFEPAHERPWMSADDMVLCGFYKKNPWGL